MIKLNGFNRKAIVVATAIALGACFHDDGGSSKKDPAGSADDDTKYYLVAVDGDGYINFYKDNGISVATLGSIPLRNAENNVSLGEVHFYEGRAFVIIQSGLKNAAGADIGGGVAVVDMKRAVATPNDPTVVTVIPLTTKNTHGPSRIVHTYVDPDGKSLWLNNDGPRDNAATNDVNEAIGADSVFRIDWTHPTDHLKAGTGIMEIDAGDGHKKSAFSHPMTGGAAGVKKYFATHNGTDQTITMIDNDEANHAAGTHLKPVKTICINPFDSLSQCPKPSPTPGESNSDMKNFPHGMDYSPVSGKFYLGITTGVDIAVAVVDAAAALPDVVDSRLQIIAGAANEGKIPAAGYVHTSHDGKWVYTVGYKNGMGYFSIVEPKAGATADVVHQVIELGNLSASSFDVAHMEHAHGGTTEHHLKIFVPGSNRLSGGASVPGILNASIAYVDIDHDTGKVKNCDANYCDASFVKYIDVGKGSNHRNGVISGDGMRAYYPNGGDCADATTTHCKTINVIDTMTNVTAQISTAGQQPGSIGVLSKEALTGATSGGGGGDGHGHSQH